MDGWMEGEGQLLLDITENKKTNNTQQNSFEVLATTPMMMPG
jgi:hypothetical protein